MSILYSDFLFMILLLILKKKCHIFADNEKEPEMEIGFPTDVKHVAHIGWDGPSVHSPSWVRFLIVFYYSFESFDKDFDQML